MSGARKAAVAQAPRAVRPRAKGTPLDPCAAGLDILVRQALFIHASREDASLAVLAPDFEIDPEFWGSGCAARALRKALSGKL